MGHDRVLHKGGCHCGAIKWEAYAEPEITVFECNCSVCRKKQISYFLVPSDHFMMTTGHGSLETYSFNTHTAKHNFCKNCGVQSFFIPRTKPDAIAVMPHCVDSGTIKKCKFIHFDGFHFEAAMQKHGEAIKKLTRKESNVSLRFGGGI